MATLLELYIAFIKIGLTAVGAGTAAISTMKLDLLAEHPQWITEQRLDDLVTLGSMLPGPFLGVTAALVGDHVWGVAGAVVALLGLLTPSIILIAAISYAVAKFASSRPVNVIQRAMRPGGLGLVAVAAFVLGRSQLVDAPTAAIAAAAFGLFIWQGRRLHPALVLLAFGLLGMGLWGRQ